LGESISLKFDIISYLEMTDFIKCTMPWLASLVLYFIIGIIIGKILYNQKQTAVILENKKLDLLSKLLKHLPFIFAVIFLINTVFYGILYILKKATGIEFLINISYFVGVAWPELLGKNAKKVFEMFNINRKYIAILIFAPLVVLLSFSGGLLEGNSIISKKGKYIKTFIGNDTSGICLEKIQLFNKYLIGYDTLNTMIKVIPIANIKEITRKY